MTRATPSSAGGWLGIVHRVRREVQRTRKKNEYAEKKGAARIVGGRCDGLDSHTFERK